MVVHDAVDRIVALLHRDVVTKCTQVVADMRQSRRLDAAEDALEREGARVRVLGRHVLGAHAVRALGPRRAGVPVRQMPPRRDADRDRLRVARIDADRVNAGVVLAAAAPLRALGVEPQRLDDPPRSRRDLGTEQAAGDRAAPQRAVAIERGRERPDQRGATTCAPCPKFFSTWPSGCGGYAGVAISVQVAPRSSERCSLTPKWPWSSAAYQPPRGSIIASVTLSPMNAPRVTS